MRVLILLLAVPLLAPGQDDRKKEPLEVRVTGNFGINQVVGYGTNTYILQLKNNTDRDLNLSLAVENPRVRVQRTEFLPANAESRVFMYVPVPEDRLAESGAVRWSVTDGSGITKSEELRSSTLITSRSDSVGMLLLATDRIGRSAFGLPDYVERRNISAVTCTPENLPYSWVGLRGLDVVVLHDFRFADTRQAQAISEYVHAGGAVVIIPTGDPGYLKQKTLADLLPFPVGEPKDGLYAAPTAEPVAGGVVYGALGSGGVYLVTFNLLNPPANAPGEREGIWTAILSHRLRIRTDRSFSADIQPSDVPGLLRYIIPPPPIALVIIIVVLFIAVVGPANYIVLFRRKRPILNVITIPAISLGFVLLIAILGYAMRGAQSVVNSITVVSARSGSTRAYERRILSLLSSTNRSYDFDFKANTFALPVSLTNENPAERKRVILDQLNDGVSYRNVSLLRLESVSFTGQAIRTLDGDVTVSFANGRIQVRNNSNMTISRALWFDGHAYFKIPGDIPPRDTFTAPCQPFHSPSQAAELLAPDDAVAREAAVAVIGKTGRDTLVGRIESDPGQVDIKGARGSTYRRIVFVRISR